MRILDVGGIVNGGGLGRAEAPKAFKTQVAVVSNCCQVGRSILEEAFEELQAGLMCNVFLC